jgi:hypothetical protein
MDQTLLRQYLATVYELPTAAGPLRVSLDGDIVTDPSTLPELLTTSFTVLTAYNPRSMLLPRKVNETRHTVMRDLLILGVYRVEACVGYDDEPDGVSPRGSFTPWTATKRFRSDAYFARTRSSSVATLAPSSS